MDAHVRGAARAICIALFASCFCSIEAGAANYYVAPNGSNLANGSINAPWLTLQHAANRVGAGDRVTVRAGNYVGFQLTADGNPNNWIEFIADPNVHITQRNASTPDGINLERADYVVIDGFNVANMPRAGVRSVGSVAAKSRFVTIRNVTADNNGVWGIFTGHVDDLLIEHNKTSRSDDEHGIYVSNSGDRPIIRFNMIWDNHANGIHMNGDLSEGGDGIISGALVEGNIIYGNGVGGGSGINMDGVTNSRIVNNLVFDTHASGISLYRIDGGAPSTNNVVVNNTVHVGTGGRWALNIQDGSTGNKAYNNILLNQVSSYGAIDISRDSLSGFISDYNVVKNRFSITDETFLSFSQWRAETGQAAHSVVADPNALFVRWQNGDYHLLPTAVAINMGTDTLAPTVDLEGRPRPIGASIDVGAFEFGALAADHDGDGDVDRADLAIWEAAYGASNLGDADGDGDTDGADFMIWQWQCTGVLPGPSAQAVPEPTTLLLVVSVVFTLTWRHLDRYRR